MLRLVPPAGTPTPLPMVFGAAIKSPFGGKRFGEQLCEYTGARYVYLTSSGRAAQALILKAMLQLSDPGRDAVVIPAYTCYTVPASIVRAGLKVRLVDVDPLTLDYRSDALRSADLSRVLAINSSNLFGIVSDWSVIDEVSRSSGCYRIDDAAQSFGSTIETGKSGLLGDVGFYSLDRGKNLSTFSGGVIVSNNDRIGERLGQMYEELPSPGAISEAIMAVKMTAYSLMLRPWLYWLPASLPFLGLGETIYDDQFAITGLSRIQSRLGESMLPRLKALNDHRQATSERIASTLARSDKLIVPGYSPHKPRIYLRLPVLAKDESHRAEVLDSLRRIGIAASTMYPDTIANVAELKPHLVTAGDGYPGAREIVSRLFTLPTHAYVNSRDIDRMLDCLTR